MAITISGDTPNFSSATITTGTVTTLTAPTSTITTLNAPSGVLATQNGMTGIAKAWVKFNGSTATIGGSFNVSSVVRNSTGNYTINFTIAMPNTNYAVVTGFQTPAWGTIVHAFSYTTSSFVWESGIPPSPTYIDTSLATAAVFSS
jgi:hypothetical protein